MTPAPPGRAKSAALWLLLVAIATYLGWLKQDDTVDDAFIYLRYARNVLEGRGWVFNEGEWVNGATSTGNTLCLILLGWLTGGRLLLAQLLVFGLSVGSAAACIWHLFRPDGRAAAWIATAMVLSTPYLYWLNGMDTPLILAFASAAVLLYARGRIRAAAVLLACLFLTRPDGIFLAALLLLHRLWRKRGEWRENLRSLAVPAALFTVPILAWIVFSYVEFGTALPQTLGAKLAQTESGIHGQGPIFLRNLYENLGYFAAIRLGDHSASWLLLFLALGGAGTGAALWRRHPAGALILWGLVQCSAYAVLNLPNYLWYYFPFNLALTLAAALVVARLLAGAPHRSRRIAAVVFASRRIAAVVIATLFLVPTAPDPRWITAAEHGPYLHYKSESRHGHYLELAEWLRQRCPTGASLASAEIGVLGFELPRFRIVDMWGLVTTGGVDAITRGDFGWWFRRVRPDFVLFHDPVWEGPEKSVFVLPAFHRAYRLVYRAYDRLLYERN